MKNTTTCVLLGLLGLSGVAQAACTPNPNIKLTRPDSRYEAVANATPAGSEVRDMVTGLVWQRCLVGMTWDGTTCTGTASTMTWQDALETARTATASSAATGAAAVWRVPNLAELVSLADRACASPAINTTWFPAIPLTPSSLTWSSSTYSLASPATEFYPWYVTWTYGFVSTANKNTVLGRVRLMRSGQ